ncbi:cation diffusion facilitator family transporter [Paenibacillus glycanilyticus]|uniref:Transporter n=1 Tax=Paenibacillus glycanilyticus TaxID=126569 RepID=A0ABQ6GFA4_9BACL|nr:cation diffusion facilitator family transporter [Paenibacillus glycanilyticus]GLX69639.1 transporter [Paenibacillus glycanilyticus]
MEEQRFNDLKLGEKGAIISIIAYIILSILKLGTGFISGSEALKADGLNNATDIAASVAVLIGLRLARKPADEDHPYGHWKSETIASLIASFIMMAVGLQVLYQAITKISHGQEESPDLIAAWVGIFCSIVMFFVYKYNKQLANKINSQAVMAAAKDNLSDALVSIGTVIGIVGSQINLPWLDPLAAVMVGIIICKTAWEIFRESSHHLSDGFNEDTIKSFKQVVLDVDGVEGIKDIKARSYGSNAVVDVTVLINADLGFQEAHHVTTKVEDALKSSSHEVYEVHIHYEPHETNKQSKSV